MPEHVKEAIIKANTGRIPWNKGMRGWQSNNALGEWREAGGTLKGRKVPWMEGKNNPKWTGRYPKYSTLHTWIRNKMGKAKFCVVCGEKEKNFEWANLSGKYKRDEKDFISLCVKCHRLWDSNRLPINLMEWRERVYA